MLSSVGDILHLMKRCRMKNFYVTNSPTFRFEICEESHSFSIFQVANFIRMLYLEESVSSRYNEIVLRKAYELMMKPREMSKETIEDKSN